MAARCRAGVIGHPVSHSRSPRMHAAGYAALGLDGWRYEAIDVAPEGLAGFVGALAAAGFRGVNVTIPHKEAVIGLCDELSDEAAAAGSVNTLLVEPHGIRGESTDGRGLLWALGDVAPGRAVVLGAGGAARAAAVALAGAGWDVQVAARRAEAAQSIGLGVGSWPPTEVGDLVVNATPIGQAGDRAALPLDRALLSPAVTVVDLAYLGDGSPTALCTAAAAQGARVVDGLDVLVGQGILAFELFTGVPAPVEAMAAAVRG